MPRCGCGSSCGCALTAGTGTVVTGAGTQNSPWVVSAVVECDDVRPCISGTDGVNYNPTTGVITADISTNPGNGLMLDGDGLYVGAGAATVTTGPCGVLGNGLPADPVRANTNPNWSYPCTHSAANGTSVYCDPATGQLHGEPPVMTATARVAGGATQTITWPGTPCPTSTVLSERLNALTFNNPSTCRPMSVMLQLGGRTRADVDAAIHGDATPISAGVNVMAEYRVNGGPYTVFRNSTWVTDATTASVTAAGGDDWIAPAPIVIPPGGSAVIDTRVSANCSTNNPIVRLVLNEASITMFGVAS